MYRPCLHCEGKNYDKNYCPEICTYGEIKKQLKEFEEKLAVYNFIVAVNEMQKLYPEAVKRGKKGICDLCVPFRDKYKLPDSTVLELARKEKSLDEIIKLGKSFSIT